MNLYTNKSMCELLYIFSLFLLKRGSATHTHTLNIFLVFLHIVEYVWNIDSNKIYTPYVYWVIDTKSMVPMTIYNQFTTLHIRHKPQVIPRIAQWYQYISLYCNLYQSRLYCGIWQLLFHRFRTTIFYSTVIFHRLEIKWLF